VDEATSADNHKNKGMHMHFQIKTPAVLTAAMVAINVVNLEAATVNVSKIATGTFTPTPVLGLVVPAGTPMAAVTYYPVVDAKTGADALDLYQPGSWSSVWANNAGDPSIKRQTNSPSPTVDQYGTTVSYYLPYYELGQAGMTNTGKQQTFAGVFRTGAATASSSYAMQVQHFGALTHNYYLSIKAPELSQKHSPAYRLEPGSNGGTYVYYEPTAAKSRSAVDVYVDGLPVWSTERIYAYPDGADDPFAAYEHEWGAAQSNSGDVVLYLGRLSAGQSVRITMVVRTDGQATANTCGSESAGWNNTIKHCFDLQERVLLPTNGPSEVPSMYLYSFSAGNVRQN
jgi:hypothetical protein